MFVFVLAVTFQSTFYSEIYQNNIFLFLKISFDINTSKQFENTKKINLKQKKFKFFQKYF
jgi:hypothetical protein